MLETCEHLKYSVVFEWVDIKSAFVYAVFVTVNFNFIALWLFLWNGAKESKW